MLALACWALTGASAGAEVRDRSSAGFTVKTTINVTAPPQRVYQDLLDPQLLKAYAEKTR